MQDDLKIFDHINNLEEFDRACHNLLSIQREIQMRKNEPSANLEELYIKEKAAKECMQEALDRLQDRL